MWGRVGVVVFVVVTFAAGLAAGAIQAGPTGPPTTGETTTEPLTDTTTTSSVQTTTTTTPTTTESPPQARSVLSAGSPGDAGCLLVAAFALEEPDGGLSVLGSVAESPHAHDVAANSVAYPADGSIVTAASIRLHAGRCGDRHATSGGAEVRGVSLFGGAVTARSVELGADGNRVGVRTRIQGLTVEGKAVAARPGLTVSVGNWGYVTALAQPDRTEAAGALAVHLSRTRSGLPAGTVVLVSFARAPHREAPTPITPRPRKHVARAHAEAHKVHRPKAAKRHRRHEHKRPRSAPLKVTPPLGISHYVFPVAGESDYIDTYGGFRGDVPGNWHHGDDIFADLGTPVLAVADGTLNRVGWERLGGWRLWVRDAMRNEFYYAHLSGYSPLALHSRRVKAGDVIGFIGNTGDAFTTSPHLHFEIHPHQLLRLDYNGAVNPTRYLDKWTHLDRTPAPTPAHPPFPFGEVRAEARFVWRQLLAARGLISHAPLPSERPRIAVPHTDRASPSRLLAAEVRPHPSGNRLLDVLVGVFAPGILFGSALLVRLRRKPS